MMKMKSQSVNTIAVHYFVEIQYKDINLKNSFSCEKMYSKCCWYKIEEADQIDDVYVNLEQFNSCVSQQPSSMLQVHLFSIK